MPEILQAACAMCNAYPPEIWTAEGAIESALNWMMCVYRLKQIGRTPCRHLGRAQGWVRAP